MTHESYLSLVKQLNRYNHHYYTLDDPLVSDQQYDQLYDELLIIEERHPEWRTDFSPSQRVGGAILSKFEKKVHTQPLLSLDKAQHYDRIEKFLLDCTKAAGTPLSFSLEQKLDGLAFVVRYENGRLAEARTRGTGKVGEIITEQVKTIKSIPLSIPFTNPLEVQGEIFMRLDAFQQYNHVLSQQLSEALNKLPDSASEEQIQSLTRKYTPLKNPRNGAAGAVRNLNPQITASRPLDAFFYNVPFIQGKTFATQLELMTFFKEQGFKTNAYFYVLHSLKEITEKLEDMRSIRPSLNYDIDGMVIKVNELPAREAIGYTSKFPKWAIAYKFEANEEMTTLLQVTWEVGRTGKLTPLAHLEPVEFDGVTVSKATLNNWEDIQRKGVKIGADVFVRRSNDVIPEIRGIVPGSTGTDISLPLLCPSCHASLIQEGAHLFCVNEFGCPSQQIGKLIHFASREAMNIDSYSEKTAKQLWDAGLVRSLTDLYTLKEADLVSLDRFGKKKAQNLIDSIETSKQCLLPAFLYALGIRHTGKGTVDRLVRHYHSIQDIQSASVEELMTIDDIGESVATSIYRYFRLDATLQLLSDFEKLGVHPYYEHAKPQEAPLSNQVFVVTGKLSLPRKAIEHLIQSHGGIVSSTVSKKTSYLVAGEDAGSKLAKAKKENIPVLTEKDLFALLPELPPL